MALPTALACLLAGSAVASDSKPPWAYDGHLTLLQASSLYLGETECSDRNLFVSRDQCLSKSSKCMWLATKGKNLCLPCEWGGVPVPCAPIGGIWDGSKVTSCEMGCSHQHMLTKASPCIDVSGSISNGDCFAKGDSALVKCQWTQYVGNFAGTKSICGPCSVAGVGQIPMYDPGNIGPEAGSTVTLAASQCQMAEPCSQGVISYLHYCNGPLPTAAPPPTQGPVPLSQIGKGMKIDENAPDFKAVAVLAPYGAKQYTQAANLAMKAAGWPMGSYVPPDAPVNIFGMPPPEGPSVPPTIKLQFAPVFPGMPGIPPPGVGIGTAPPMEAALLEVEVRKRRLFETQKRQFKERLRR